MARRIAFSVIAFILLLASSSPIRSQSGTPVLGVEADHFTVNGTPTFLFFVSYFDALNAPSAWDDDLAYLSSKGVSGVRIFVNWWSYATCGATPASRTLINFDGSVDTAAFADLQTFLSKASAHNMLVDITFTRGTVVNAQGAKMSFENFQTGFRKVTTDLASYRNVLFDVGNEYKKNDDLDASQAGALATDVELRDRDRLVAGSDGSGNLAETLLEGFDFVAYHDDRNLGDLDQTNRPDWYTDAAANKQLSLVRNSLALTPKPIKPIDLQEPMPWGPPAGCNPFSQQDPALNHARDAAKFAKIRGAAIWTFHTRLSFRLSTGSLKDKLIADPSGQKTELEAAAANANSPGNCWGVSAKSVSSPPPATAPASGTSGLSHVAINGTCGTWTATSDQAWAHVTPSGAQSGDGDVSYSIDQNFGPSSRVANITIAGKTFAVTQNGMTPSPPFTDNPLVGGVTVVQLAHIVQLQTRIDHLRQGRGLPPYAWGGQPVFQGTIVAQDILALRANLDLEYQARSIPTPTYTPPAPAPGVTISAQHVQQIRSAVCALEGTNPCS